MTILLSLFLSSIVSSVDPPSLSLIQKNCATCHDETHDLDLSGNVEDVAPATWRSIERRLETFSMPPEDSAEAKSFNAYQRELLIGLAKQHAGKLAEPLRFNTHISDYTWKTLVLDVLTRTATASVRENEIPGWHDDVKIGLSPAGIMTLHDASFWACERILRSEESRDDASRKLLPEGWPVKVAKLSKTLESSLLAKASNNLSRVILGIVPGDTNKNGHRKDLVSLLPRNRSIRDKWLVMCADTLSGSEFLYARSF